MLPPLNWKSPIGNLTSFTGSHVSAGVRDDPDGREDVQPVLAGRLHLGHVHGDADEEDGVREGRVDAPVQWRAPLLGEPRDTGRRPEVLVRTTQIFNE